MPLTATHEDMHDAAASTAGVVVKVATEQQPEHAMGFGEQPGDADGSRFLGNRPSPTSE